MNSCNSGDVDLVSTSADEDYGDSSFPSPTPPPPSMTPGLFHCSSSSLDSLSSYHLDSFVSSPNLDSVWSRRRPASSLFSPSPPVLGGATIPNSGDTGAVFSRAGDGPQPTPATAKSGKKRSRASRRAPTTVLTTDTTNFRQMVQEFTGIPTPPFGCTSPFSRVPRLDFLGGSGAVQPPVLLRSFPQKAPILTHLANNSNTINSNSSGSVDISPSNNTSTAANSGGLAESAPELLFRSGYQPATSLPNTLFNLQSRMNSAPKFQFPSFLPGKPPTPGHSLLPDSMLPMNVGAGILNQLGRNPCHTELSSQGNVGTHMINSMNISTAPIPSVNPSRLFMNGIGGSNGDDQVGMRQPGIAGDSNALPNPQRGSGSSCKINYGTSSSEFHVENGSEAMSRGEGMVESWICSSD